MENVFLKVFNLSLVAGVIVIIVIIGRLLLNRVLKTPKWVSCLLWIIVALRLIIPWTPATPFGILPANDIVSIGQVETAYGVSDVSMGDTADIPVISTGLTYMNSMVNEELEQSMMPAPGASADPVRVILFIGSIVWIAGIAAMIVYAIVSRVRIGRKVREALPCEKGVFEVDKLATPFILGIVRPAVYLPSGLDERSRQAVLAHERAHLSRRDHWWKPFGFLLLAVYWFNPLIWVAYVLLCRDIEMACDEKAVADMEAEWRKDYSETLLALSVPRRMITACPVAFGEVCVKDRIRNVLNYRRPAFWIVIVAVITCAVMGVLLLTGRTDKTGNVNIYDRYFSEENNRADYKDPDKVKKFLRSLPDDIESLENSGILIANYFNLGDPEKKKQIWNTFAERVNANSSAVLTVAGFTDEGDPIFQYLYFDGTRYYYSYDNTRDKFGSPQEVTLDYYYYLYSFRPTGGEFEVILSKTGDLTYSKFLNMCLYWDVYLEQLEEIRTIAEMSRADDLTDIRGSENGFLMPGMSARGFVRGTYLNIENIYTASAISMERYPGDTVYSFTDDNCEMYPRNDPASGPFSTVARESAEWEDFYTDTEWEKLHEDMGTTEYRNEFEGCTDIKKMRFSDSTVLILADDELYVAKITDRLLNIYRLARVEDRWCCLGDVLDEYKKPAPGLAEADSVSPIEVSEVMKPTNAGLVGVHSGYVFVPVGDRTYRYQVGSVDTEGVTRDAHVLRCTEEVDFGSDLIWDFYSVKEYPGMEVLLGTSGNEWQLYEYCPAESVPEENIEAAKAAGFVVMENGSVVSGKQEWEQFLSEVQKGNGASVNLADVYRRNGVNMSNDLSLATQEDYPCMYCRRLTFDDSSYTVEPLNRSEVDGEYTVYERKGIDNPTASYRYLMHYTGKPSSPSAKFTTYDKYVLTNDNTVTWEAIEKGMYSSTFGDWIVHDVVFNEYEWKK